MAYNSKTVFYPDLISLWTANRKSPVERSHWLLMR